MKYTESLRKHVAELFEKATDQEVIKKFAVVENEINELDNVLDQKDTKEMELLKDLKEAYLHTSIKPDTNQVDQITKDIGAGNSFDANAFIESFVAEHNNDGSKKN